jgi:DNA processing protein
VRARSRSGNTARSRLWVRVILQLRVRRGPASSRANSFLTTLLWCPGVARGVDAAALTAAIDAGGRVIGVIGTPLGQAYPAGNTALQEQIARDHLLVSQFPDGAPIHKGNFPERNRLMAALTDATVIVEASDTSGTLHQAAECVRLRRRLFITRSAMEDRSLHWPQRFKPYSNVATMSSVEDVLAVLSECRSRFIAAARTEPQDETGPQETGRRASSSKR